MGRRGRSASWIWKRGTGSCSLPGSGTVEACRAVGITRKTGYRWRAERGGLAPLELAKTARSNRYLSALERRRIATLRGRARGPRDRPPVGRDAVDGEPRATPQPAGPRPRLRRRPGACSRPGTSTPAAPDPAGLDPELRAAVQAKLELEWSPEQIAGWLRATFPRCWPGTSATRRSTRRFLLYQATEDACIHRAVSSAKAVSEPVSTISEEKQRRRENNDGVSSPRAPARSPRTAGGGRDRDATATCFALDCGEPGRSGGTTSDTELVAVHHGERLRAAHARGARLASVCTGAFVLAAAGLLDGRTSSHRSRRLFTVASVRGLRRSST